MTTVSIDTPPAGRRLDDAATGRECRVVAVEPAAGGDPQWPQRLGEIGVLPGEHVTVTRRALWGGDPLVVRVGESTFALRRAEAACIRIEPL